MSPALLGSWRTGALLLTALLTALPAQAQASFSVELQGLRGNEWWIEVEAISSQTVALVETRVDEGPWTALANTGWGSWARSVYAPAGSLVDFRTTSSSGAVSLSGIYEWPSTVLLSPPLHEGEPPPPEEEAPPPDDEEDPPPTDPGDLTASFTNARGNEWWVEVEVSSPQTLVRVEARLNASAFIELPRTGWGSWAVSVHAPAGTLVDFRATSSSGATSLSGLYQWPHGTLVAPPPSTPETDPPDVPEVNPPSEGVDVAISVNTAAGPNGATSPVRLPGNVLGVNVADWESADYMPSPHAAYLAYLKGLRPAFLRWPAGHSSQNYAFVRVPGTSGMREITATHVDAFMALAREVGAQVVIGINVKTQPPENAADFVRYLNVERGYGVRWFHIGNEPDHLDGLTSSPQAHVQRHLATVAAMKAVDPSIRIVGAETMTGASALGLHGMTDWMTPVLQGASGSLDAVSWHWYQLDSGQWDSRSSAYMTLDNLFQESAPDWNPASIDFASQIMPALRTRVAKHAPGARIWITEYGEDPGDAGGAGLSDTMAGALWAADSLGRFLGHGPGAILKWPFKQRDSALSFLDNSYAPRPEYLAWWLYTRHFGDEVVAASSSRKTEVNAHAAWRSDGKLALVLVNKATTAKTVSVDIAGFIPAGAVSYTLRGSSDTFGARSATLNGQSLTTSRALNGVAGVPLPASGLERIGMAPVSVVLIVYE